MFLKKVAYFLFFLVILFAMGCEKMKSALNGTDTDSDPDGLISISRDDAPVDVPKVWGDVVILEPGVNDTDKWGNDAYELNSATIADDTLTISVSYSGGCKKHEFTLIANNAFMESDPVQLGVSIVHNANNDPCEAYPTEEYHFDLTPIKTMYQEAYQQEAGTIILRLKDAPNTDLVYEFTM
ncbi:hypothetical protein C6501_06300 [Candidatus Poribacteria bacterium]|nr:MAG: hypothetical protein C6501_06300 [Candidatus Poribacteria bacterium]